MTVKAQFLASYKQLLRSLIKSNRRSKISQINEDNKKQIALLTYRKINLVRQQASEVDSKKRLTHLQQTHEITKLIENLKANDPVKLKSLYFYDSPSRLRHTVLHDFPSDQASIDKRLQHLRDISGFIKNQMEYEQLVERYNPGLKMDQEEKVKRTAARVGLRVPDC
ncbi:LANO_0H06744g1_1 [Lachancea nothofagi CBS 11611]|uniref:LANO_0H06744g1_1 n=1 Tax=Lachancea nothofagi CBS 11611 TaxID=1266666 RepID=A0A1G4KLX9_9SACH|nr:LANO_0H06744g1_1 [Lachancea nothofagi CBS 11611]